MAQHSYNNQYQQNYQDPNAHYPQDQVNTFGNNHEYHQEEEYYDDGQDYNQQYYYDEYGQVQQVEGYYDPNNQQSYYDPQQQQQYQQPNYPQHQGGQPPLPSKGTSASAPPLPGRGVTPARRGGPPGRGPRGAPPPRRAPKKSGGILGFVNKGIDATIKTASKTTQQIATASNGKPTDEGAKRWEEAALGERLSAEFPAKMLTHNKAMQGSICVSPSWFAFLPVAKQNPNVILSWVDIERIIENHKSKQKGNYAPVFTAQEKTEKKVNAFIVSTFSGASYQFYGFKMAYKTAISSVTGTMSTAKRRGGAPVPAPAPTPNKVSVPHPVKQAPSFPLRGPTNSNPPLPNKSGLGGAPPPLPSKGSSPSQQHYPPQQNYQQNYDPSYGYSDPFQQPQQVQYSQTSHGYQTGHFNPAAPPLSPEQQQYYGQPSPHQPSPQNPGYSAPHRQPYQPSYPPQNLNPPALPPKR